MTTRRDGSKTLTLTHRPATGLEATIDVPDTELGRETTTLVGRGDLAGCSFAFRVGKDSWFQGNDADVPTRVIESIDYLGDVSICTLPSYSGTSVWVRSASQPDDEWLVAVDARNRRLRLLETEIRGATESRWGQRISRPAWFTPANLTRRGCGHVI